MKHFLQLCILLFPFILQGQQSITSTGSTSVSGIVITEIMADPDPPTGLPNAEYCEIFNAGSDPIDLAGWSFFDGSSRSLPAEVILPGSYMVICDDDDTSLFTAGNFAPVSSISLTNGGEKISIRDATGFPVDSVEFSDSWYGESFKKDGGWSLEKIDPAFPCQISQNWKVSESPAGGTPGTVNSVNGIINDPDPPILLRSFCPDSITITLLFNEPVIGNPSDLLQKILLSPPYQPIHVTFESTNPDRLNIQTNIPIDAGYTGQVLVSDIFDCAGNRIPDSSPAAFGIADSAGCKNAVINEILFNPRNGGSDFIELFNNGYKIMNICDLKIGKIDITTGNVEQVLSICDEIYLLFPGDYVVITESSVNVEQQYHSPFPFKFIETTAMPSMNTDEGYISLFFHGEQFDSVHYSENFHFALLEDKQGVSLERIHPDNPSNEPESWHSAAETSGFATPGLKNSQYFNDEKKNQPVNLYPEIFSPDMDGIDDFISISLLPENPGFIENIWIYNSSGQVVYNHAKNSLTGTNAVITWDGITESGQIASPGIYIALISLFNEAGSKEKYRIPFVLAIKL